MIIEPVQRPGIVKGPEDLGQVWVRSGSGLPEDLEVRLLNKARGRGWGRGRKRRVQVGEGSEKFGVCPRRNLLIRTWSAAGKECPVAKFGVVQNPSSPESLLD